MPRRRIACLVVVLLLCASVFVKAAPGPGFVQTKDGIIIYPDTRFSGGVKAVKLQVISDKIIRVTAFTTNHLPRCKQFNHCLHRHHQSMDGHQTSG